jgi:hypothetical protein
LEVVEITWSLKRLEAKNEANNSLEKNHTWKFMGLPTVVGKNWRLKVAEPH